MKKGQIILALLVSTLSVGTLAGDKKEFGRENVFIAADPATMKLLTAVTSKVDAKFLQVKPKFEYRIPNKSLLMLCGGSSSNYPDMVATAREMNADEFAECQKNNAGSIIKVKLGYEAMVVVADKKSMDLDLNQRDLFLAVSRDVPNPKYTGVLMDNFYKTWNDIDSDAPKQTIKVFGPADKTRDARSVGEVGTESGCRTFDWVANLSELKASFRMYREICHKQRKDGHYIMATADTDVAKQVLANKNSIGLMGFNDWLKSKSKLKAYAIDEMPPTIKTISKDLYPLSRSLYVYIKADNLHKVKGLSHLVKELLSESALGEKGYLAELGLVAMPEKDRKQEMQQASEFKTMEKPEQS